MRLRRAPPRSGVSCRSLLHRAHACLRKRIAHQPQDALPDLVLLGRGIHLSPAPRIGRRHLLVTGADALVKGRRLAIQSILRWTRNPGEAGLNRQVEQDRQVRLKTTGGLGLQPSQRVEVEATAITLVSERRIRVAIAEDQLATCQPRADHLLDVLRSRRSEEQRLRPWRHRDVLPAQQNGADHLPHPGTARFAGGPHWIALLGQRCGQAMDLRRLPTALGPLEADEEPAWLRRGFHAGLNYSEFSPPWCRCADAGSAPFRCCARSARGARPTDVASGERRRFAARARPSNWSTSHG